MLFHRSPKPQFGESMFALLIVFFTLMSQIRPVLGLAGLGTVLIMAATLVELNRQRIWDQYKKTYKKRMGMWHAPKQTYYQINVYILWPVIALLGALCLWSAYALS